MRRVIIKDKEGMEEDEEGGVQEGVDWNEEGGVGEGVEGDEVGVVQEGVEGGVVEDKLVMRKEEALDKKSKFHSSLLNSGYSSTT